MMTSRHVQPEQQLSERSQRIPPRISLDHLLGDSSLDMALTPAQEQVYSEMYAGRQHTQASLGSDAGASGRRPTLQDPEAAGRPSTATGRPSTTRSGRPNPHVRVDPHEPLYEAHDLHGEVAHELRLQGGVVGRVHAPKREKVHLGPYLRCRFDRPPSEQLAAVPSKLLQEQRPSSANPRLQAVPPHSPRSRAASAAPRGSRAARRSSAAAALPAGPAKQEKRGFQASFPPHSNPSP